MRTYVSVNVSVRLYPTNSDSGCSPPQPQLLEWTWISMCFHPFILNQIGYLREFFHLFKHPRSAEARTSCQLAVQQPSKWAQCHSSCSCHNMGQLLPKLKLVRTTEAHVHTHRYTFCLLSRFSSFSQSVQFAVSQLIKAEESVGASGPKSEELLLLLFDLKTLCVADPPCIPKWITGVSKTVITSKDENELSTARISQLPDH